MGKRKPAQPIQTLDRSSFNLRGFIPKPQALTLSEIAKEVGLDRSTVYRFLGAMELRNMVEQNDSNRYRLGLKLVEIGYAALEDMDLRLVARPVLQELVHRCMKLLISLCWWAQR